MRFFLGAVVDGDFLTDTAEELLKRKEVLKVPVLMGITNHEFGWILPKVGDACAPPPVPPPDRPPPAVSAELRTSRLGPGNEQGGGAGRDGHVQPGGGELHRSVCLGDAGG